ncbi:MAG: WbqC family protein [Thermoleophilaceae bacterium]|nr:WbqC family protein [Thermoleophilaceae bacterium]
MPERSREVKRVAIVQSNYVPWKGYFDLIGRVDEFILLDDVQYTRRDWRNRNRIKTPDGLLWLTVPVRTRGHFDQSIDEVLVSDPDWAQRHWQTLRHAYGRAPGYQAVAPALEALYGTCDQPSLSQVNAHFLRGLCGLLGISTRISRDTPMPSGTDPTERLVTLCQRAGATEYLAGPSSWAYLRESAFTQEGIAVTTMRYGPYPHYSQLHGPFEDRVSVLDVLFHVGTDAPSYVVSQPQLAGAGTP